MSDLLNVDEAIARILEQINVLEPETIHLTESAGRVLAEDIVSDTDLPPFDNSAMDGFAIRTSDSGEAVRLKVVMDIPAGVAPSKTLKAGEAARIMTGAPVPDGADAVIPVEDTDADFSQTGDDILPEFVTLDKAVSEGAAIRRIGENIRKGQTVLESGTVIGAAEVGMLASLGESQVSVIRQAHVAIVGSGDELVGIDEVVGAGQIRDSNSYTLAVLIADDGAMPLRQPIASDSPESLREMFQNTVAEMPDLIVSSAGVSVGAADYVRTILEEIGEIGFWRINLRPGKPLAFGKIQDIPFFGLPGNPVSAMVTYMVLVRPALMKLSGKSDSGFKVRAKAGEAIQSDGRRTYARVQLREENGETIAYAAGTQSSGAHMSMVLADGLLVIPEGREAARIGEEFEVLLF